MDRSDVHLQRVGPNKAPGGVWIRVCALDRLITEYAATDPAAMRSAAAVDQDLAADHAQVWIYFYDGDDGHCMRTLIAEQ